MTMPRDTATIMELDDATRALVIAAAAVAGLDEAGVRRHLQVAAGITPHEWMEEMLLQTYLFAGFPRALNAMREWRRIAVLQTPVRTDERDDLQERGEETCAAVYGAMYAPLRRNVAALHPLLDRWMITEGYGKILARPGLDLGRRELCIVAACAATGQDRQLQSHLHGSRNVGVPASVLGAAIDSLDGVISAAQLSRARGLWAKVRNVVH